MCPLPDTACLKKWLGSMAFMVSAIILGMNEHENQSRLEGTGTNWPKALRRLISPRAPTPKEKIKSTSFCH